MASGHSKQFVQRLLFLSSKGAPISSPTYDFLLDQLGESG
jgi:hypothetical protein